jgi:L-iditol 2-dehydrogenase
MLEPVNTVLKGINKLSLLRGDCVLVVGQGPIGLMFTRLLYLRGVHVIATDLMPERLRRARSLGARWTVCGRHGELVGAIRRKVARAPIDGAVITVPSDKVVLGALQFVRGGGKVLLFAHTVHGSGCEIDLSTLCVEEKDLIGSYSSDFELQREAAALVFSRRLDVRDLVTDVFPLEMTDAAVCRAASPVAGTLKLVVSPIL